MSRKVLPVQSQGHSKDRAVVGSAQRGLVAKSYVKLDTGGTVRVLKGNIVDCSSVDMFIVYIGEDLQFNDGAAKAIFDKGKKCVAL